MISFLPSANKITDLCQQAYSETKKVAEIKVYKDWTVFDIAKVVAVVTCVFVGLHYIFGSNLLRAWTIAKWYRSVYEPFDGIVLFSAAITSLCSGVYWAFQRIAPPDIDVNHAMQFGTPEFLDIYREKLTSQPTDFWGRSEKNLLLEILHGKVESDARSVALLDDTIKNELRKFWCDRMAVPQDIQQLSSAQILVHRATILSARREIPWQNAVKECFSQTLMRNIEQNPADLPLLDKELSDSLCRLVLVGSESWDNASLVEMLHLYRLPEVGGALPWQQALQQALLEAIAKKVDLANLNLLDEPLMRKLEPIFALPQYQRNNPFLCVELRARIAAQVDIAGMSLREIENSRQRFKQSAVSVVDQLRNRHNLLVSPAEKERSLVVLAEWCIQMFEGNGALLGSAFVDALTRVENDLYTALGDRNPSEETRELLIDLMLLKHKVEPLQPIDLKKVPKIFPSLVEKSEQGPLLDAGSPKLQKLVAIILASHLARLLVIEDSPETYQNDLPQIPETEALLQYMIKKSTVSLSELSRRFASVLHLHQDLSRDRGYNRENTEEGHIGWKKWTDHGDSRIKAVFRMFMYVVTGTAPASIPRLRVLLKEILIFTLDANRDPERWTYLPDLRMLVAGLNSVAPPQAVDDGASQRFQQALQDVVPATREEGGLNLIHPHYFPPPALPQVAVGGGFMGLFGQPAALPRYVAPQVQLKAIMLEQPPGTY